MIADMVARRYASALFALDGKEGLREDHGQCLDDLAEMLAIEPKLGQTLKSPLITATEKKAVMDKLLQKLHGDALMRNFCNLLADKNRLGELAGIAACYRDLLDEANGILRGSVTTAIQLDGKRQAALKENLKKKVGRDIEVKFYVDPEILGGMVLAVGDKVVDSSLRAQLGILRETLIRGM